MSEPPDQLPEDATPKRTVILPASFPSSEKSGDRISHYKLLQEIGEGGMGTVWMAEQTEPVRRRVALKVIKLGMDTKQVVGRFEAERQALALMDHPNIAKVLDAGATENGRPFFVMELVKGVPITEYCDREKLNTQDRLNLFIQVCQAIQHAHQKGIIHRDIKPSNILVTMNDGVPMPKVIDFGIAKATGGQVLTDKTVFTAIEQFIGTPAYMSPEQAEMNALDIDTRSDIYALGVLLYELLTGKTPFDSKTLISKGLDEIRRIIREEEPMRPSNRLSTLDADEQTRLANQRQSEPPKLLGIIRGDLDWIVMKTLEKDRRRRYDTANGLAMDIQRYLENEPIVARPPSNAYKFQKLVRRNKVAFVAVSAVIAALVIGLSASTWMFIKEKQARQRAVVAETTAQTEAKKSQQVARFLQDMLGAVGPSVALGRDTQMLREILDKTSKRVGDDLKNQPLVEAELRETLGNVYGQIGQLTNAIAMHQRALEIRKQIYGAEHRDIAKSLNELGEAFVMLGEHGQAEPLIREALTMRRKFFGNESLEVAETMDNLGIMTHYWRVKPNLEESESMVRQALAVRRKLLGNENVETADSLEHLGIVLNDHGKPAEAEAAHREALMIRRRLLGNEHPDVARSMHGVAWTLNLERKFAESETMLRETLGIRRKLFGNEHPEAVETLIILGTNLREQKKYTESEIIFRQAIEIQEKVFGRDYPGLASTITGLADSIRVQGRFVEAGELYRRALNVRAESFGRWHPHTGDLLIRLAGTLRDQGKTPESMLVYRKAADLGYTEAQIWLGIMYENGQGVAKNQSEAEKWYQKATNANVYFLNGAAWKLATSYDATSRNGHAAVRLAEIAVERTQRKVSTVLDTLAAAYAEAGDFTDAAARQREALELITNDITRMDYTTRLKLYEANIPYRESDSPR